MFYSHCIVDEWNSLSEEVVMSPKLNCFKSRQGSHSHGKSWKTMENENIKSSPVKVIENENFAKSHGKVMEF